jgi:DNA modification methylase
VKRLINIKSVVVPEDRQRREFDPEAMQDLQSSIERIGLLQAPVLELTDREYVLRAGERRYRAMLDIYELGGCFDYDGEAVPPPLMPHVLWTELGEIARLEIEVDENNQRQPFTWQEKAAATARLARLREMQAEDAGLPPPTVATLAQEVRGSTLGSAHTDTRNELILSKHLHDPEVTRAKTAREAMTVLKRKEQAAYHERLAAATGSQAISTAHSVFCAEAREWAAGQPPEGFDVVLTDPPYGMGADTFGEAAGSTATSHGYSDDASVVEDILDWFPAESFRLAKPQAHLYVFCDLDWFPLWRSELALAGWKVFRTPLIWVKPTGFRTPWIDQGPQRKYETILYAVKGEKHCNMIAPDVLTVQSPGEGLGHPAAKPPALYEELLRRSVKPGDRVLDLFGGTGPLLPACAFLRCAATVVEMDSEFYGICVDRLNALTAQKELLP